MNNNLLSFHPQNTTKFSIWIDCKKYLLYFLKVTTCEIMTYMQNIDFDDDEDDFNMADDHNGMDLWP